MEESYVCFCCGDEQEEDDVKKIEIKGKAKKICRECLTTIKGLA